MIMRSTTEHTIISVSTKMSAGGSVTAVGSGVAGKTISLAAENPETAQQFVAWADIGVAAGIIVGVIGLVAQIVFMYRKDARERELHKATLDGMRKD